MWPFGKIPAQGVDSAEVSRVLFHPHRDPATGGLEPTETDAGGIPLGGLWRERAGSDDVVLFFHGNGELAVHWAWFSDAMSDAFRASVWLADYRGYGRSGGIPSYGTMLRDAETMWRALAERECRRGRAFARRWVMGRSIGSAAAIHVAWRFPETVAGLVVDSGFSHLPALVERLGGGTCALSLPRGFPDNADKLPACRMPTLFLHGTGDRIVPVESAHENLAASGAAVKWLHAVEGAGHNDLIAAGGMRYWQNIGRLAET